MPDLRGNIIAQASALNGLPYRLDPPPDGIANTDCSLFVLTVLKAAGIPLPAGVRTAEQIRQACVPVPFAAVLPGDLLFFEHTYDAAGRTGRIASHIGISLGAGTRRMWDANEAHDVGETDISTKYWQDHLFEARRPPGLVGVTVRHTALVSPQTVEVQYKLEDSGSWVSLGTSSTVGATSADFDFPAAITADLVAFKLVLTGTAGSSTALKVYGLSVRYVPSPGAKREWSMTVRLQGTASRKMNLRDGTAETRTGEELSAEVWALVDGGVPVNLVDIDRAEYTVQISEWREGLALFNTNALDNGFDLQGSLRLTEV